jgi:hypothetical protein
MAQARLDLRAGGPFQAAVAIALHSGPARDGRSRLPQTDRRRPSDSAGTGQPYGFGLAS